MGRLFSYEELDESFFDEASELLENAAGILLAAEKQNNVPPVIPEVFRTFHTIKGGAQMVGCDLLATFAHQMEDLLDQIRTGQMPADLGVATLVLDAMDLMEEEISIYKQGEHPDALAERQTLILDRIHTMNQREKETTKPVVREAVTFGPPLALTEESPSRNGPTRLTYLWFIIDALAPMPEISEILIRQRLQESGRIIHFGQTNGSPLNLTAILQTDLADKDLQKACDAADVKAIHIKELSIASFFQGSLPLSAVDEFLQYIYELEAAVSWPDSAQKTILGLVDNLSAWGNQNIEASGCFPGGRSEWDRALMLLKAGTAMWNRLSSTPEQRLLLAHLTENLWECVYANLKNKFYFFNLNPGAATEWTTLLQDVKRLVKGSDVKVMVVDLSAVAVLEEDAVSALMEIVHWLHANGIVPAIIAQGDFRHRHYNAAEALALTMDGLTIQASAFQACRFNNLPKDGIRK